MQLCGFVVTFLSLWLSQAASQTGSQTPATEVPAIQDCTLGSVRLVGGVSGGEGRVEVCLSGVWSTVCDDGWDLDDATVVCQQLGLGNASNAPLMSAFGEGTGAIAFDGVDCTGNESSLFDCTANVDHTCTHAEDASVVCSVFRIGFERTSYSVIENEGVLNVCITSEQRSSDVTADVNTIVTVNALDGTAFSGNDYRLIAEDVISLPTSSVVCIMVDILDNSLSDGDKMFTLRLSTDDQSVDLFSDVTSIFIFDDNVALPSLQVNVSEPTVLSGNSVSLTCRITFTGTVRSPNQITWTNLLGEVVNSSNSFTSPTSQILTLTQSTLTLSNIFVSQAGFYVCRGRIDSYGLGPTDIDQMTQVVVEIAPVSVILSNSPQNLMFYIGRNITVSCIISTDAFVDINITPTISWEVSYSESDGQTVSETIESAEISTITPVVFLTSLEYTPILRDMTFTCFGSVEPTQQSLDLVGSEETNETLILIVPDPPLSLNISPLSQDIAAASSYNSYSLLCNASVPIDITNPGVNFVWTTSSQNVEILMPNSTVSIVNSVTSSGARNFYFVSNLTVTHTNTHSETIRRRCLATVTVNGLETESTSFAEAVVNVKGPTLPNFIFQYAALPSSNLTIIEWYVPSISFTPEVYTVQYHVIQDDSFGPIMMTMEVQGNPNVRVTNERFQAVIEGLAPSTTYSYRIVLTNQVGDRMTSFTDFITQQPGAVSLIPSLNTPNLSAIPLGASTILQFQFSLFRSGQLFFLPLYHTPLQQPQFFDNSDTGVVTVTYINASPSLSGAYVLCKVGFFPSKRRRKNAAGTLYDFIVCSDKVTLDVITPSLSISTNLLVGQTTESFVKVSCIPSEPFAPVRWRTMLGTYDELSSEYNIDFSENVLMQIAVFSVYEGVPPDRTEVFLCDLINVDEPDSSVEVAPQSVTVRFLSNPVAILNHDREIPNPSVINSFSLLSEDGSLVLSLFLRCFATSANPNLTWESMNVSSLSPGVIAVNDAQMIPFIDISFLEGIAVNNRDVILRLSPINNQTTGFYSCRSSDSVNSYVATVFTTQEQPFWRVTSPRIMEIATGVTASISALFADFSDGTMNTGSGFDVEVMFIQNDGGKPRMLMSMTTAPSSYEFVYSFIAGGAETSGDYVITATHRETQRIYNDNIEITVTVPQFIELEDRVVVRQGDSVTLTCLPSDLRAPVQWAKLPVMEENNDIINFRSDLFTLSPRSLNHSLSFIASQVALVLDNLELSSTQLYRTSYRCGLYRLTDESSISLTIQPENVRMQYLDDDRKVYSNTVINRFQQFRRRDEDKRNVDDYPSDNFAQDHLDLVCAGAQGNHKPVWFTDNPLLQDDQGAVSCVNSSNNQYIDSNYTSRLRLFDLDEDVEGVYTCTSQLSGETQRFQLTKENPYVAAISPLEVTVIELNSLTLEFKVAVNSDGNSWDTSRTSFTFNDPALNGIFRDSVLIERVVPFQVLDSVENPHNYVYTIPFVRRSDEGTYTARVMAEIGDGLCETPACGSTQVSINVTVIPVCPPDITSGLLWPRAVENNVATLPCTMVGTRFTEGTSATRPCLDGGTWGEVDLTTCSLSSDQSLPFLIVFFTLIDPDSELPFSPLVEEGTSPFDSEVLVQEMANLLENAGFRDPVVSLTSLISISNGAVLLFEILLTFPTDQDTLETFNNNINNGLMMMGFGRFFVDENAPIGVVSVSSADSCQCGNSAGEAGSGVSITSLQLCTGLALSPCNCNITLCNCRPPYVGDGRLCTLDSDGDGYPDEPLQSPSCLDPGSIPFCNQDNCPNVQNVDQDPFACQEPTEFDGCPYGVDAEWNIEWPNTDRVTTATQPCPGELDSVSGQATRYCGSNGEWNDPNVLNCRQNDFVEISIQAIATFATISDPVVLIERTLQLTQQLSVITAPELISLLPSSLNTTNQLLSNVLDVLETAGNNTSAANEFIIDVLDNILDQNNTQGWTALQEISVGSQMLLDNTERFAELLAMSLNSTGSGKLIRISRPNIAISAMQLNSSDSPMTDNLRFPQTEDLLNFMVTTIPAEIEIPALLLEERLSQQNGGILPITFILLQNLEMFLPPSVSNLNNASGASMVISSQVGLRDSVEQSEVLQENPISINFTFNAVKNVAESVCVYWNFSDPVGNGSWVREGVTTVNSTTNCGQSVTTVQCASTHLTSFAVLVDVAGGLRDICEAERLALQVVSYVGCAVSILCLILTIIFFLAQGKKLLSSVHYFVHFNLAISLLLAYVVFVLGVETAVGSVGGCTFVALLLHYLFLSAFCWMLCEGVMLYLLLVVVFSQVAKKWWFFLLLGYVTPIPFVVITVAARSQFYGVRDETGNLQFCWLSTEEGTIFGFVAPMLLIILINVVFLVLALRAIWNNQKKKVRRVHRKATDSEKNLRIAKSVLFASLVLLPLLGSTWVFGLLTVNTNTTFFAWIFTILNSLQGVAIFFFHVIRNDKVWGKIRPKIASTFRSVTQRSKFYEPNSTSKSSTYTNSKYIVKSTRDSELGMDILDASTTDSIIKKDFSSSQMSSDFSETKFDLAAESAADTGKLVTVSEEPDKESTNESTESANEVNKGDINADNEEDSSPVVNETEEVIANPSALEQSGKESKNENDSKEIESKELMA